MEVRLLAGTVQLSHSFVRCPVYSDLSVAEKSPDKIFMACFWHLPSCEKHVTSEGII